MRFHLRGVVVGFRCRIIVQESHVGTAKVDQQESLVHCVDDDSPSSSEVSVELSLYAEFQNDLRFAIVAYDSHEGLTDEEAMVARRDGTFPLVRKGSRISASAGEAGVAGHDTEQGAGLSMNGMVERVYSFVASRTAHRAGCDANCLANSDTETTELHPAHHPPLRDVSERESERERERETNELHGEHHPWLSSLVLSRWWQVAKEECNCAFRLWVL